MFLPPEKPPVAGWARRMLVMWVILLVPWLFFGPASGMAFDGGYYWSAYVFAWSAMTYPLSVGMAFIFKRKCPALTFLPLVNIVLWLGVGLPDWSTH